MKKAISHSTTARVLAAVPFFLCAAFLVVLAFSSLSAASRAKVEPNLTGPTPFSGTYDPHPFPCASTRHHFTVPAGEARIIVQTSATLPTNDISITLLYGADPNPVFVTTEDTATSSEALTFAPAGGVPAGEYQIQICQTPTPNGVPQMAPYTYNGNFSTDNTAPGPTPTPTPQFGPIPPAPVDAGPKVGYEIHQPPGTLINVVSSSQGPTANTVEYLGRDAGEPSMGISWRSPQDAVNGITAFQADLQTLFVKFDDSCPLNGTNATWYNSQAPTSQFVDSDPIGFVDPQTGRAFAGQLTLLSPSCKISYTDTDGKDPLGNPGPQGWVASTGPLGSGIDHQTIGGGPYHAPIPSLPTPYPHAVYYASQDLVTAFAFRSDDGGAHFSGPYVMYTSECTGLHGHIKVTPDTPATQANGKVGTVFLPNNSCSGDGAVVVSETDGTTWTIRPVPQTASNPNFQDPAVAIDANGRVYFNMSSYVAPSPAGPGGSQLVVATSDDNGQTWQNVFDVGSVYGLKNVMYPAAVAGDGGRAAVAFFGSTVGGDPTVPTFTGIWHLYVAHTFDGGQHWTTSDATPNDPVQRGPIWAHGAADIARNMLDFFDMGIDKQGRVQVGFADGCVDGACVQAPNTASGNAYTDRTTIARQSGGRRMFAANDPQTTTKVPGMPIVSAKRVGNVVTLSWSLGDDGNSPITGYNIMRGTKSGMETLLTPVGANQNTYTDTSATDPSKTYYYKVIAQNAVGTSCPNNEVSVQYNGDTCSGLIVQRTPPNHPEQNTQGAAPPSLAIDYIAVGEPPGTNNLLFKMKVTNMGPTPPPNSRWRILWNSYAAVPIGPQPPDATAEQFYVGMATDGNGVVSFKWGTVATQVVGLAVGVPTEFESGSLPGSSFSPDGTINLVIPKSLVGNPQPGDLLGAVNGRTFTGDTSQTVNLERSTLLIDHTFVKAQRDNGEPAATYQLVGNITCPVVGLVPISAVSRKTHGSQGDYDVTLPLVGTVGVEPRHSPNNAHRIVVTFPNPVSVGSVSLSGSGTISSISINGSTVSVDLANVADQQTITLNLLNVNDGTNTGDVAIPMGVLLGDVNGDRTVNSADAQVMRNQSGHLTDSQNFRSDSNTDGTVNSADATIIRANSSHTLDPGT